MQNLPQKSIDLLSHINQEIGIDITKYENDEIIGKLTGLIMIQNYAISSLYKPLILSFGIFILGFFTLSLELLGYIVYGFFGFILFALIGVFYGIIKMLSSLNKDLLSITKFALDTTNFIINDLNQLNDNLRDNIKNPVGLIFEGALAAFVTPFISEKCKNIPFAGKALVSGSDKVLDKVVITLKNQEDKMNIKEKIVEGGTGVISKCDQIENFLDGFSSKVDNILNVGFRSIKFPFRVALICIVSVTSIFMLCVSIF